MLTARGAHGNWQQMKKAHACFSFSSLGSHSHCDDQHGLYSLEDSHIFHIYIYVKIYEIYFHIYVCLRIHIHTYVYIHIYTHLFSFPIRHYFMFEIYSFVFDTYSFLCYISLFLFSSYLPYQALSPVKPGFIIFV